MGLPRPKLPTKRSWGWTVPTNTLRRKLRPPPITTNTVDSGTLVNRTINNTYPNRVHDRIVRHNPGVSRYPVMTIGVPLRMPDLKEKHRPKLTDGFWKKYAPKRGCSVVSEPNEPIQENSY